MIVDLEECKPFPWTPRRPPIAYGDTTDGRKFLVSDDDTTIRVFVEGSQTVAISKFVLVRFLLGYVDKDAGNAEFIKPIVNYDESE